MAKPDLHINPWGNGAKISTADGTEIFASQSPDAVKWFLAGWHSARQHVGAYIATEYAKYLRTCTF